MSKWIFDFVAPDPFINVYKPLDVLCTLRAKNETDGYYVKFPDNYNKEELKEIVNDFYSAINEKPVRMLLKNGYPLVHINLKENKEKVISMLNKAVYGEENDDSYK
jgi:hypothetical protein